MANNTYFDTTAIGKKLFAYVSTYTQFKSGKVQTLLDKQFKNSLIVIGDEGRMYSPATKTYIGIGNTAYQNTINMIENVDAKVDTLNKALTASLVSGIYVNMSAEDIKDWNETHDGPDFPNVFATNDILIKGIGDYDVATGLATGYQPSHIKDANTPGIENIYTYTDHDNKFATSGIRVRLDKGKNLYRFDSYVDGAGHIQPVTEGAEGKWIASASAPTDGSGELLGEKIFSYQGVTYIASKDSAGKPIFKNGSNVISIDDEMTWAYISASNAYALEFAKDFTKSEVNRIYSEILGYGQDTIIPVSKEQVLDVVVNGKLGDKNGVKLNSDTVFFVKCPIKAPAGDTVIANTNKEYPSGETDIKGFTYTVTREVKVDDPFTGETEIKAVEPELWTAAKALTTETVDGKKYYFAYEAGDFYQSDYVLKPITAAEAETIAKDTLNKAEFVVINPSIAEVDNINISDGIQTLKEVAHVLDVITNGNYDSQDPEAAGIELAYSIAQNHIDILDLDARVDKIEAGTDTVKSLKEGTNGKYVDLTLTSDQDPLPVDGPYSKNVTIKADLAIAYTYAPDAQFPTSTKVSSIDVDPTTKVPSLDTTSGVDITYAADTTRQGLADVAWTTAYVSDARKSITEEITAATFSAYQYSYGLVNSLNSSYTVPTGYFVSGVSIENGKIKATATDLPSDQVVVNTTVWGEDTDALKQYKEVEAGQIATLIKECAKLYKKDGTTYVKVTTGTVTTDGGKVTVDGKQAYTLDGDADANFVEIPVGLANQARYSLSKGKEYTEYIPVYVSADKYSLIDIEDIVSGEYTGVVYELIGQPEEAKKYISAEATHNVNAEGKLTGENTLHLTAHITKIEDASAANTGLVDAYDVKQVIDNIFEWVDLSAWATE